MVRALYTGESGLKSHQTRMDVIGNNISNVNTVGFKSSRATFGDMLSQNLRDASASNEKVGSTNVKQIGLGVNVASTDLIFKNAAPMVTGKNTDLALSGDGLFVVRSGNQNYYTRDGAFEFDSAGNYVLPSSGHFVQGWMAQDGVIDTTAAVGNIQVMKGQVIPATATTEVNFQYNLDANLPLVKEITGGVLTETVTKVPRTETVYEEVDVIGVLEQQESLYNLNVKIGNDDYILHQVESNDIDLSKNWKVQSVNGLISTHLDNSSTITLEDDDGNTSVINLISKGANNIKVGDAFSADTSLLRFKSTVNEVSPLDFIVDGVEYQAIRMGHSVEIPGEGWVVTSVSSDGSSMTIEQYENGENNGCSVGINLASLGDKPLPTVGSTLEFSGDSYTATKKRPVTITTYDEVVTVTTGTYTKYNSMPVKSSVNVYDSSGNLYEIPVYFVREGELEDGVVQSDNHWLVSLEPNSAIKKGAISTYTFPDANGNKVTATMPAAEIQFDPSGQFITNSESDISGLITLNFEGSGSTQNVTVNFDEITQYDGKNTINSQGNGNVEGTLKEINISSDGIISGVYTNGIIRPEAQVSVAHFTNSAGLTKISANLYQENVNSGTSVIGKADEFGVVITPGALEMSNVDIGNEFTDMIISQRGFQANAKLISVEDEMIETAINTKR